MNHAHLAALGAVLALSPATARAGAVADLAAIDSAVERFTGAPIGVPGGAAAPVDRRLRLNPCAANLSLGWYGARRDAVEISCPVAGGWRLFVPVAGSGSGAEAAPAVLRGDAVTISVSGDGFAVSQPGEALESGAPGAWIKVRGLGQGAQVLRGKVLRPGLVGIDLP